LWRRKRERVVIWGPPGSLFPLVSKAEAALMQSWLIVGVRQAVDARTLGMDKETSRAGADADADAADAPPTPRARTRAKPTPPISPPLPLPTQNTKQNIKAGGHHHHPADTVTYAGLALPRRSALQYAVGKTVGAACWFWVFFMLYNEWDHKVKGLPAIFEAEGLDEDDHHGEHH
jgi:guanyl-specific ribonuclease Sa